MRAPREHPSRHFPAQCVMAHAVSVPQVRTSTLTYPRTTPGADTRPRHRHHLKPLDLLLLTTETRPRNKTKER